MRALSSRIFLLTTSLLVTPAFAQAINDDGARKLGETFAAYLGKNALDQKIVTVAPDGDAYKIVFDPGRLAELYAVSPDRFRMGPWTFRSAPLADGTWSVKSDVLPPISVTTPMPDGDFRQEMRFSGYRLDGIFDPKLSYFSKFINTVDFATSKASNSNVDVDAQIHGLSVDLTSKAASIGIDVKATEIIKGVTETVTSMVPGAKGAPPSSMSLAIDLGTITANVNADALRSRDLLDLWAFFVANAGKEQLVGKQDELKSRLKAALPLWNLMSGDVTAENAAFRIPQGTFGFKSFTESLRFSGLSSAGTAALGLKFDGLTMPAALLPSWAGGMVPTAMDLNVAFSGADFDQIARLLIDQTDFKATPPLPLTIRDRIVGIVMSGKPKVSLTKSRLTAADYDISLEGEMQIAMPAPTGTLTVSAKDFDRTVTAIQQVAQHEPQAQQMLPVLIYAKGLAKAGSDGQSVWVVEYGADGVATVNGQRLGPPKK